MRGKGGGSAHIDVISGGGGVDDDRRGSNRTGRGIEAKNFIDDSEQYRQKRKTTLLFFALFSQQPNSGVR